MNDLVLAYVQVLVWPAAALAVAWMVLPRPAWYRRWMVRRLNRRFEKAITPLVKDLMRR